MRDKSTSSAAGQQQHQHNSNHHHNHHSNHHRHSGPVVAPVSAANIMASDLSEGNIFSPGAVVEVKTIFNEEIIGEVLAFEYDAKLLILKSKPLPNSPAVPYNVTCVNLELCSKVQIVREPSDADRAAADVTNSKLPDIDLKKLSDRLRSAIDERKFIIQSFTSGAGTDGVALYSRLQKTVGDHFGISWEADSIIIGKNIQIAKPYGANCISVRNAGPNAKPTSLDYAKQLVEKYWRDQEKDPYTLEPLHGAAPASSTTTNNVNSASPSAQQSKQPLLSQPPAAAVSQAPVPQQQQQQQPPPPASAGHGHTPAWSGQSPKGKGSGGGGGGGGDHHRGQNVNRKSSPHSANQPPHHHHAKHQQPQQANNHHHEPLHQAQPSQRTKAPSYAALLAKPDGDKKTNSGSSGTASSGPPSAVRG